MMMHIPEFTKPGQWPVLEDSENVMEVEALTDLLVRCVEEASLALYLFNETGEALRGRADDQNQWSQELRAEWKLRQSYMPKIPPDASDEEYERADAEATRRARVDLRQQQLANGVMPSQYVRMLRFMHARSFLYAFDTVDKTLALLAAGPGASEVIAEAKARFKAAFPDLTDVRDSAHHLGDRVQGKRRNRKIDLQPISSRGVDTTGGVLVIDHLNNDKYGSVLGDGRFGEIEVTVESVKLAQDVVQTVLDSITWRGSPDYSP
ncbi:hypothetical protein [Arthrobacter sp. fls2-241-R2A-172]|uniref:hypothetical protein n=1 Tax=Arthrobacter sp. fls2-241-R2A-172 TaxID=3040325 RepID=UPI00254B5529|nr:hypothetical protein [Arthrobacter sp. fls2-241-R2A-172]